MAPITSRLPFGGNLRFFNSWFTTYVYIRKSSHTSSSMRGPLLPYLRMKCMHVLYLNLPPSASLAFFHRR